MTAMRTKMFALGVAMLALAIAQAPSRAQTHAAAPAYHPAPHGGELFQTSHECMACHNGLTTPSGEDVSIGVAWRASMMANSGRDPYWLASVRRETLDHPAHRADIEDECSVCHMPMARTAAVVAGRKGEIFAHLTAGTTEGIERQLATDGVSCTLCHQIGAERLGTAESFTGGFVIRADTGGEPRMLGPYRVEPDVAGIMASATGFRPDQAPHLRASELCATCHTLITQAFGANGEVIGRLPEQVPYQEWRHSAFRAEKTCQQCHMPPVADPIRVTSVFGEPREQMGRHTFLGGNFFMLRLLNRHRTELGVQALPQELEAAARATVAQLQAQTAALRIARAERNGDRLAVDVQVANLTGHKLPTGYPARRTWVHFTVTDREGRRVFESGAMMPSGAIAGNDGDADAGSVEPHHDVIRSGDEVQVYESVMGDPAGRPTTGLLSATQFIKDNRLLPRGFDKATAPDDIAVRGAAAQDTDFDDAGDQVRYDIAVSGASGPFDIQVELLYQPVGFRWAQNLSRYNAPETKRFVSYYTEAPLASSTPLVQVTARVH